MGDGGYTKTSVYHSVEVHTQTVMEDDTKHNAIIKENLKRNSNKTYGLQNYFHGLAGAGMHQFINYKNFSKQVRKTLPQVLITNDALDLGIITEAIAMKEGIDDVTDIHNVVATWNTLGIIDWVEYRLQELYDFRLSTRLLHHNGKVYSYDGQYSFQSFSDNINIEVNVLLTYIRESYKDTLVTVLPFSDTEELKITTVTSREVYIDERGVELSVLETELSRIEERVPIDTAEFNYSTILEDSETLSYLPETVVLSFPLPPTENNYTIYYETVEGLKVWVYFPTLKNYPAIEQVYYPILDNVVTIKYAMDILPVTMLKGGYFGVDEYDGASSKVIDAGDIQYTVYKPSFITEKTYDDNTKILKSIGISLDTFLDSLKEGGDYAKLSDAFIAFAISPEDEHPVVSKGIYEFFKEISETSPLIEGGTLNFSDNSFNASISYLTGDVTIEPKVIGPVGAYQHKISNTSDSDLTELNPSFGGLDSSTWASDALYIYTDKIDRVVSGRHGWSQCRAYRETVLETYYTVTRTYKETHTDDYGDSHTTEYTVTERHIIQSTVVTRDPSYITKPVPEGSEDGTEYVCKGYTISTTNISKEINPNYGGTFITCYKQITDTTCEKIQVIGLTSSTRIGWTTQGKDTFSSGATNPVLTIPIPVHLINKLSILEKIDLLERSLRVILYSEIIQVVKQYVQTGGFFQVFLQIIGFIVAILIAVFSFGSGTPISVAIVSALQTVIIGIGISLVVKLLLSAINDPTIKMILGVIGAVVGMIAGGTIDVGTVLNTVMTTAVEILNMSTAITMASIEEQYKNLMGEAEAFATSYEARLEELEEAWKSINEGLDITDMVGINFESYTYSSTGTIMTMSPTSYFDIALRSQYNTDLMFNSSYDIYNYDNKYRLYID